MLFNIGHNNALTISVNKDASTFFLSTEYI